MAPVRIVDVSYVAVPAKASALPPPEDVKLNAMEVQWLIKPLLEHVLFFEGDHLPPFDALVNSLRCSLSATLATSFAPLAGKLVHLADTGEVAIRRSSSDGVMFVVAESEADARRLAGSDGEEHDAETLERLVPRVDMGVLPAPILAVQATRLEGGGVALGVTVHHAVADGRAFWKFVEAWAAACRGDAPPLPPPCFDRSRVSLPGGEELARTVLRNYFPNLPVATPPSILQQDGPRLIRWTFTVDAQHMDRLKQRIVADGGARRPPSRFVAVAALAWTCFVRCKSASVPAAANDNDDGDASLLVPADARGRLDPPAGEDYFGACLTGCLATVPARELRGERALAAAASAVDGAVRAVAADPVAGWDLIRMSGAITCRELFLNVSGGTSFGAYEAADFGWGTPALTVPARMSRDGQVAMVQARDGHGVQLSVSILERTHMDAFKSEFLQLLQ